MVKLERLPGSGYAPSSTLGIMRFFDTDSGGPKLTPEFVVALCAVFAVAILVLQLVV